MLTTTAPLPGVIKSGKVRRQEEMEEIRDILRRTHSIREVQKVSTRKEALRFAGMYLAYCEPERPFGAREVHWYWGAGAADTKSVQSLTGDLPDVYRIQCSKPHNDDDDKSCWYTYDRHKTVVLPPNRSIRVAQHKTPHAW